MRSLDDAQRRFFAIGGSAENQDGLSERTSHDDLVVTRLGPAVADVLEDRGVEQERLLGDDGAKVAQRTARSELMKPNS